MKYARNVDDEPIIKVEYLYKKYVRADPNKFWVS